ncbi:MAG: hypothetical protein K1X57_07460 [Gemmataceae bacterium]|nr:hypothetical protein [Gemmataceae bacterium]
MPAAPSLVIVSRSLKSLPPRAIMQITPVIDIKKGEVVRAVGGDRAAYAPIESELCPTGEPLPFAFALRERFNCTELYLADLDAIAGDPMDGELIAGLVEMGFVPWVDAGVRDAQDALRVRSYGCAVVVGTETLAGPDAWERILRCVDGRKLALSLDLRDGRVVAPGFDETDPVLLATHLLQMAGEVTTDAPSRVFVIDIDRVGAGRGVGTESLLQQISRQFPECAVHAGGGVRGPADVARLERFGLAGVLVSTALHEGTLQPAVHV